MQVNYQFKSSQDFGNPGTSSSFEDSFRETAMWFWESQAGSQQVVDRFWIGHLI